MTDTPRAPGDDRRVPPDIVLRAIARFFRLLIAPFIRLEIRGGACARDLRTGVIVANHRSMGDAIAGLVVLHHFGHYPRVLIAREWVEQGWTGYLARAIGAIPVDRGGDPARALDPAVDAVRAGRPVLVMPEGRLHRGDDPNTTGAAKTGAVRIAAAAHEPIVLAALSGTAEAWAPGRRLPKLNPFRRSLVLVRVADVPLAVEGSDSHADTDDMMHELRQMLRQANDERAALR